MKIYLYDGSVMECGKIEIGFHGIIVDEHRLIRMEEITKILDENYVNGESENFFD